MHITIPPISRARGSRLGMNYKLSEGPTKDSKPSSQEPNFHITPNHGIIPSSELDISHISPHPKNSHTQVDARGNQDSHTAKFFRIRVSQGQGHCHRLRNSPALAGSGALCTLYRSRLNPRTVVLMIPRTLSREGFLGGLGWGRRAMFHILIGAFHRSFDVLLRHHHLPV